MTVNLAKLIVSAVLAIVLIVALLIDGSNRDWATPVLGLLVGYVIGNTQVVGTSPIVRRDLH